MLYPTLFRMSIIKIYTKNKYWRGHGKKVTFLDHWWECKLDMATMENSMEVQQKMKNKTTI